MAKKKKKAFDNILTVRQKYKSLAFVGTCGKFQFDEPRILGEMTLEELVEFKLSHDEKTVGRYLVGEIPPDFKHEAPPTKPATDDKEEQ